MKARIFSVIAIAAIVSACGGGEGEAGGTAENSTTTADTAVVPGQDTVSQPMVVPTQDTAVTQTTTTTTTDTTQSQGQATGAATTTTDSAAAKH